MSRQPASNTDFVSKIYFFQKIKKIVDSANNPCYYNEALRKTKETKAQQNRIGD